MAPNDEPFQHFFQAVISSLLKIPKNASVKRIYGIVCKLKEPDFAFPLDFEATWSCAKEERFQCYFDVESSNLFLILYLTHDSIINEDPANINMFSFLRNGCLSPDDVKLLTSLFVLASSGGVIILSHSLPFHNHIKEVAQCLGLKRELRFGVESLHKYFASEESNQNMFNRFKAYYNGSKDTQSSGSGKPSFFARRHLLEMLRKGSEVLKFNLVNPPKLNYVFTRQLDEKSCRTIEKKLLDAFYAAWIPCIPKYKQKALFLLNNSGFVKRYGNRYDKPEDLPVDSCISMDPYFGTLFENLLEEGDTLVGNSDWKEKLFCSNISELTNGSICPESLNVSEVILMLEFYNELLNLNRSTLQRLGLSTRESLVKLVEYFERSAKRDDSLISGMVEHLADRALEEAKMLYLKRVGLSETASSILYSRDEHESALGEASLLLRNRLNIPNSLIEAHLETLKKICKGIWSGHEQCEAASALGNSCCLPLDHAEAHVPFASGKTSNLHFICACGQTMCPFEPEPWSEPEANLLLFKGAPCCSNQIEKCAEIKGNHDFLSIAFKSETITFQDFFKRSEGKINSLYSESNFSYFAGMSQLIPVFTDSNRPSEPKKSRSKSKKAASKASTASAVTRVHYGWEYICSETGYAFISPACDPEGTSGDLNLLNTKFNFMNIATCPCCTKSNFSHPAILQRLILAIPEDGKTSVEVNLNGSRDILTVDKDGLYFIRFAFYNQPDAVAKPLNDPSVPWLSIKQLPDNSQV